MVNQSVANEPLETLAAKIAQCANEAEDKVLEAVALFREARKRVEAGEADHAGKVTWAAWARKNIKLSGSRLRELRSIAEAEDPKREIKRLRELNNARQERHREKLKEKAAVPLRNGSADIKVVAEAKGGSKSPITGGVPSTEAAAELGPEHQRLIAWAQSASLGQVRQVLSYIEELKIAAPANDADRAMEPAAA